MIKFIKKIINKWFGIEEQKEEKSDIPEQLLKKIKARENNTEE